MRSFLSFLWGLLTLFGAASPAAAQKAVRSGDTISLSVEAAVARAKEQNESVLIARAQVGVSRADVSTARAQSWPRINGLFNYIGNFESPT
jgi:outer membrane protein TolC